MDLEAIKLNLVQARELLGRTLEQLDVLPPATPTDDEPHWDSFIRLVASSDVVPHRLKPVAVAQAIQETGRGKSGLFLDHNNPFGMKWRSEMQPYAVPAAVEVTSEERGWDTFCSFPTYANAIQGYWAWMDRSPYVGYKNHIEKAMDFIRFIGPIWSTDPDYTRACIGHLPEARKLLGRFGWKSDEEVGRLQGDNYLLDAGHSRDAQGASSRDGRVTEYSQTSMMVGIMSERLKAEGAATDLFDPNPDNLEAIGRRAKGKTAALFTHLNAANRNGDDEGCEGFVHPNASAACRELCALLCENVSQALGCKNRGVKTARYTVLVEAHQTGAEFNVLMESYFLDDWTDPAAIAARSTKAAHAMADGLIEYFGS